MKKVIFTFLTAVIFSGLILSQTKTSFKMASATSSTTIFVKNRKVVDIPPASGKITIDGNDAESTWSLMKPVNVANGDSLQQVFSASFMGAYDANYLYLYIYFTDDTPYLYDGTNSWQKDGAQVYLDVRNKLLYDSIASSRQHQLNFPYGGTLSQIDGWNGSIVQNIYCDTTNQYYVAVASTSTIDGYNMEMRIPWASMYYNGNDISDFASAMAADSIKAGDTLGFDLECNDYNPNYNNGDRQYILTWSSYSNDTLGAYQNSGIWGGLRLATGTESIKTTSVTANAFVYPNPATNNIHIIMPDLEKVEVVNTLGDVVLSKSISGQSATLDVTSLTPGLYLIRTTDAKGRFAINKININ